MLKRTLTTLGVAVVCVFATATAALADYPPTANVKGETVQRVAPDNALAFTGSNTFLWIAAAVVLLVAGATLLAWANSKTWATRDIS